MSPFSSQDSLKSKLSIDIDSSSIGKTFNDSLDGNGMNSFDIFNQDIVIKSFHLDGGGQSEEKQLLY